jgi:hypothetical protein
MNETKTNPSFYIQRNIPTWGIKTFVNWAVTPKYKAVVFIHGFNGSSMETFGAFNYEFRYRPEYEGRDVYFYGYDSLFQQISNSALGFLDFLKDIHYNLPAVVNDSQHSIVRNDVYSEIVIICHSLGAVVTRVALNEGYDAGEITLLDKCKLILFAPAHKGARKSIGNLIAFPPYLKALGPIIHHFVLTLDELLEPKYIIEPMEEKCMNLISMNKIESFTIAKKVIWAGPERVVHNGKFGKDPTAIQYKKMNISHVRVCKPSRTFTGPFEEVEKILNQKP